MNIISAVWKGELSLPATYWLWGVIGGFIWGLIAWTFVIGSMGETYVPASMGFGYIMLIWPYLIWIGVGIWRSGRRYSNEGKGNFWPLVANTVTVIGFIWNAFLTIGFFAA